MASIAVSGVYTPAIFVTQISPVFFNQSWASNRSYQYLITISVQCIGYGLAGLLRPFLVYPNYCLWPSSLPTLVLIRSLHERSGYSFRVLRWRLTRYRYFLTMTGLYLVWMMYKHLDIMPNDRIGPGYIFSDTVENFNWMVWIKPDSKILTLITGGVNGLGLNPLPTLDWNRFNIDVCLV